MKPEDNLHFDHMAQAQRRSTFMAKLGDKNNGPTQALPEPTGQSSAEA